ncbi:MAG: hypothetical protein ABH829_03875 [archaeon]
MKRLLLLLPLLVLGCVGGTSGGGTIQRCEPEVMDGVLINAFSAGIPSAYIGEGITFTMEVENFGSSPASSIAAELTSLGGLDRGTEELVQTISDLDAYVEGAPAPDIADWVLYAPSDIGTLQKKTATVRGRLSYDFVSTGQADVIYMPSDEWRQRQKTGDVGLDSNMECSNGPIAVTVLPLNPLRTDPGASGTVTLRVLVSNDGTGIVKNAAGQIDVVDSVTIDLPDDLHRTSDCDFTGPRTNGAILSAHNFRLIGGEKYFSCRLELSNAPLRESRYPITAILNYRYELEQTTNLDILSEATYVSLDTQGDHVDNLLGYIQDGFDYSVLVWDAATSTLLPMSSTANPWVIGDANRDPSGNYLVLTVDAAYSGSSNASFFECTAGNCANSPWSATIRNDDSKTYKLVVNKVEEAAGTTGGMNADDVGPFRVYLDFPVDAFGKVPASTDMIYAKPDKLTMQVSYKGQSASRTVDGIEVDAQ